MSEFLLSRWEAVELFAQIICRAEESSIDDFIVNNRKLRSRLEKYRDDESSKIFAENFPRRTNTLGKKVLDRVNLMSYLSRSIISGLSFPLEEDDLRFALNYIEDRDASVVSDRIVKYSKYTLNGLDTLNDKQRRFEKTHWWFYFYASTSDGEFISKSILSLLPFGRVKLTTTTGRVSDQNDQYEKTYQINVGHFYIYGKNEDQLKIDLKTESNEGDNGILLYIGRDVHPFSVGIFTRNYRYFRQGTAYSERITNFSILKDIEDGKEKELVDLKKEEDFYLIDPIIRDFLLTGKSFDVKKQINEIEELKDWTSRFNSLK